MDYSQLSDFEINKRIAETVYSIEVVADDFYAKDVPFAYHRDEQVFIFIDEPLSGAWRSYNPCNNPADAWPIIIENKISTMWMTSEKEWCAWAKGDLEEGTWDWENVHDYYFNCESQLRAAMIVFLMMQDANNV